MAFGRENVKKVANLARIEMTDEALDKITPDLQAIIGWVDQLESVNVDGVEPLLTPVEHGLPRRQDIPEVQDRAAVIANAPDPSEDAAYFTVPKVKKENT